MAQLTGTKGLQRQAARQFAGEVLSYLLFATAGVQLGNLMGWDIDFIMDATDPRFLRLTVGDKTTVDISGGQGGLYRVAAQALLKKRFDPDTQRHIKSNRIMGFGHFIENKVTPALGTLLAIQDGERWGGKELTVGGLIKDNTVPISAQTMVEICEEFDDPFLIFLLESAEILGASANVYDPVKKSTSAPRPERPERPERPSR